MTRKRNYAHQYCNSAVSSTQGDISAMSCCMIYWQNNTDVYIGVDGEATVYTENCSPFQIFRQNIFSFTTLPSSSIDS